MWSVVLLFCWLLGAPVEMETLIGAVGAGIVMQIVYSWIGFETRGVKHNSLMEVTRILRS